MLEKSKQLINLAKIFDPRGNLTVVEQNKNIPFYIKEVRWLYGIRADSSLPVQTSQGQKFIVPLSGSFRVRMVHDDTEDSFLLNHPYQGLLVESGSQYTIENVARGSVCLVIDSQEA